MLQTAVFVDAGYLHAQGSTLLAGSRQRRERNRLNVPLLLADLVQEAVIVEPNARLLRIYWYDGVARGGLLSHEQVALSQTNDVKCRFGVINSQGQQKGVDSLIVTDLVQLAREKAVSDALLLAGDEDLRVGVQVAQTFGIRVHLLGIHPARGSQSPDLRAEADTTREWGREKVAAWMAVLPEVAPAAAMAEPVDPPPQDLAGFARGRVAALTVEEVGSLLDYADRNNRALPGDFDRPMLGSARHAMGRDLTETEKRTLRGALRDALRDRLNEEGNRPA